MVVEEPDASLWYMILKIRWKKYETKKDLQELKENNLHQKIEKLKRKKKEEKYAKLRNIKSKRKEELFEDKISILKENKRKRSKYEFILFFYLIIKKINNNLINKTN